MSIFTYENLYRAYLDCRKNKRKTINALKFEINLENNLNCLLNELKRQTYCPGQSICFVVTEPVPREIFAADFRDRVVHHLLIKQIIKYGERNFINDSYACRLKKGTHRAVKQLKRFIRKIQLENPKSCYLKLDISGFFMNIDKEKLYAMLKQMIIKQRKSKSWKGEVLWLARQIIFHNPKSNYEVKGRRSLFDLIPNHKSLLKQPEGRGLPIGNYTSQFFANLYLNGLDQFVKRELRCRSYVRYVDDFILLHSDREKLKKWKTAINLFLQEKVDLRLNQKKTKIQPISRGVSFLGYFIMPDYSLVKQKVVKRLKNKLYYWRKVFEENGKADEFLAILNSYLGHFAFARSYRLKQSIYLNYLGLWKNKFEFSKNSMFFKKLVLSFGIVVLSFLFLSNPAKADYYNEGILKSTNVLSGATVSAINSFTITSSMAATASTSVQFSQDRVNFYDSAGTQWAWDSCSDGATEIDLSGLGWSGGILFYKLKLETSDSPTTPSVTNIQVDYEGTEVPADSGIRYPPEGTLVSEDLLAGFGGTLNFFNGTEKFGYNITSLPAGTAVYAQFSQDGVNWYSSDGTAWAWDTLSSGSHLDASSALALTGLGWSGDSFYYKLKFTTIDSGQTPVVGEVGLLRKATQINSPYNDSGNWYDGNWKYKRAIVLNNSQISTTTNNFPILATTTLSDLKSYAYDGNVASGDGHDIIFVDDDNTTLLNFEREYYDPATGEIAYWIKTDISSTTDKTIYMYYGNASASDQATTTGVWDDNFVMVQHLQETPAGTTYDSTSNDNDGTTSGMDSADQVAGQIDGSLDFDGADWVNLGATFGGEITDYPTITISSWVKLDTKATDKDIVAKESGSGKIFELRYDTGEDKWYFAVSGDGLNQLASTAAGINTGQWYHIVGIWDGSELSVWSDTVKGPITDTFSSMTDRDVAMYIGSNIDFSNNRALDGLIDEVRISNVARTAGWIATEYNNQVSVGDFMTFGAEESLNRVAVVNAPITNYLTDGLVGHWTFNGQDMDWASSTAEALDRSGNSNNGNVIGATAVIGKVGQGLEFDGVDDYIDAGDVYNGVKTVVFWIKADGTDDITYFDGQMDEVRFYNNVLSADEIGQLYRIGARSMRLNSGDSDTALSAIRPSSKIINLDGTANIEVVSGAITANGFTDPSIYVDASATSTIDNSWRFVAITTGTGINASAATLGKVAAAAWICGTDQLTDYDGNTYNTVLIGTQCWMAENLMVLHNADGSDPNGTGDADTTPPVAFDDANWEATEGYLYNYQDAMNGSTAEGAQGICPTGWHVPTHYELTDLERYICEQEGGAICDTDFPKDITTTGWLGTHNEGRELKAVDNVNGSEATATNGDDGYGFTGLLAGYRGNTGAFGNRGTRAFFWSSAQYGPNPAYAWYRYLHSSSATVYRNYYDKGFGFSVRCLKD